MGENRVNFDLFDENNNMYFRLGRAKLSKANTPLNEHSHIGMVEIVLMIKGSQVYTMSGQEYHINSGEAFITLPNELHSSGIYPEDKSLIYYLIADPRNEELCLGYDSDETNRIYDEIYSTSKRVIRFHSKMKEICDNMMNVYCANEKYKKTILRNLISEFFIKLADCIKSQAISERYNDLDGVLKHIESHISEDISVSELADIAKLSESRLKARFREEIGIPPREYILREKIERAKVFMSSTDKSIIEIAYELGFASSQYFSTVFKRYAFLTPRQYKYKMR